MIIILESFMLQIIRNPQSLDRRIRRMLDTMGIWLIVIADLLTVYSIYLSYQVALL